MPLTMPSPRVIAADTITSSADAEGQVVVSGSHGGRYPGYLAARAGVRAVIFNDAGVGKEGAGIGSLADLEPSASRPRPCRTTAAPSATRTT